MHKKLKDRSLILRLKHPQTEFYYSPVYWDYFAFDIALTSCENDIEDIIIGTMEVDKCNLNLASDNNYCEHCAFDSHNSMDIDQYVSLMWDHEKHVLSKRFAKAIGCDFLGGNVFVLQKIQIRPEFRGNELGLIAIAIFHNNFTTYHDMIILKAFPLQFDEKAESSHTDHACFSSSESMCRKRLANHYQKLGFQRVGRSDFYFFNCENRMIINDAWKTYN